MKTNTGRERERERDVVWDGGKGTDEWINMGGWMIMSCAGEVGEEMDRWDWWDLFAFFE